MIVNLLIITMVSIVTSLFGIEPYLEESGINYEALMISCLIWGMGGAFISLLLSRVMARWMMGVRIIDPKDTNSQFAGLLQKVHRLARSAGINTMPQVGVYEGRDINAFATGPSKNRSLVAVSTGLLEQMNDREVEGVLGHEIAHITNGDMVTMTLVQGIVNAFVMFFARVVAYFVSSMLDERYQRIAQFVLIIGLQFLFSILASPIVFWFSRWREFRADAGGARLAGRDNMIAALEALKQNYASLMGKEEESVGANNAITTMKISGKSKSWKALFSTHPPLEQRIEQLKRYQY